MSRPLTPSPRIVSLYSTPTLPFLSEQEAFAASTEAALLSSHIFPADPSIFTRNLALLDHYTFVAPSTNVAGELGLFARCPIHTGRSRLFIGLYSGALYSGHPPSSFSPSARSLRRNSESYSLHLRDAWFVQGYFPHIGTHNMRLCVLAHANEWIWDPQENQLQFGPSGCVYVKPNLHIEAHTELTIYYGDSYAGWDTYKRSLLVDLQAFLRTQTRLHDQYYWSLLLDASFSALHTNDLSTFRSSPPTLAHLLLALVEYYGPPLHTSYSNIRPDVPLIPWLQQLAHCPDLTTRVTFRKAHHPHRGLPLPPLPLPPLLPTRSTPDPAVHVCTFLSPLQTLFTWMT